MRRKILVFLGLMFISLGYSQSPRISVSASTLSDDLASGDTSVVTFIITNTGNRDLVYSIDIEGTKTEFSKKDYADWTLKENQDIFVPDILITRQNSQGIFNIFSEDYYSSYYSPENTEWATGMTKNLSSGDYDDWQSAVNSNPPDMVENYTSMHVIDRDMYFDIYWKSWTEGGNGGGFSYIRYEVPFWIRVLNNAGSLAPTQKDTIHVVFDGRVTNNLIRQATIKITSNDPANAAVIIPASLSVSGSPVFEVSDTALQFENTFIGTTSSLTFSIWNTGVGTLNVSGISNVISVFTKTLANSAIVTGHFETVTVNFLPTAAIVYEDTLIVTTNDAVTPVLKVAVSGTGLSVPDIAVTPASVSKAVAFGIAHPYGDMDTTKLVISNPGDFDLTWQAYIRKASTLPVLFEKEDFADYTLLENQDIITDNVRLTRNIHGGLFNMAVETSDNWNTSPLGVLWYNGPTAESYMGDYERGLYETCGDYIDLVGRIVSMYVPENNKVYDVTFHNWTQDGNGGGFSYTRIESVPWLLLSNYENTVAPSNADTILVLFNPRNFQESYDAEIVLTTNVPGKETTIVPVHITASGPPVLDMDSSAYDFGNVFITKSGQYNLELRCYGASPLIISNISTNSALYTVSASSMTIDPDSSKVLTITFTPAAVQSYLDTLTITTNSLIHPIVKIPLSGAGLLPPEINIHPTTMTHSVVSGDYITDTLFIGNTGESNLEWTLLFGIPSSPAVTFTKEDYANVTLPQNQDRVSENVWITRDEGDGLYNRATEDSYDGESPEGTKWYFGYTGETDPSWYYPDFIDAHGNLNDLPGDLLSMYVLETNKYYDVLFHTWTPDYYGGGFSYTRREVPTWLSTVSTSGTVLPGDTSLLVVYIDADMLPAGTYSGEILVESNDPENSELIAIVNLTVTGEPEIAIDSSKLGFGETMIGYPKTIGLVIRNNGTDVLNITNIAGNTGKYVAEDATLSINAFDSAVVNILFTPTQAVFVKDTLSIASNDALNPIVKVAVSGTGIPLPEISVIPNEININLFTDSLFSGKIIVQNNGASNLIWSIPDNSLETILQNLNNNYQPILDLIPNRYYFAYDGGNSYISDGGYDMYDQGNYMTTDIAGSSIIYSDNIIADGSSYFGANSRYFTRHLPGLFVMAADINNINYFELYGNNGADGSGNVDGAILDIQMHNNNFQGFLKRVYNAWDPSINQMVIVEKNANVTQDYSMDSDNTNQQVSGLATASRIYYILYSGTNGLKINDQDAIKIMEKFILTIIRGYIIPNWITFDKISDTIQVGDTDTIKYAIEAGMLKESTYSNSIYILSNDPANSEVVIPLNLQYGSILTINPLVDVIRNEGFSTWSTEFGNVFQDPKNDVLSYIVVSYDEEVVVASKTNTTLNIAEEGVGTSMVTVRAEDTDGNVAYDDFDFRVNGLLKLLNPVADDTIDEGFTTHTIDLSNVFSDVDGDPFTIAAVSSATTVATVSVTDMTLTITEVGIGKTTITLTATGDGVVTDEFVFEVNGLINVANPIADVTLTKGFGTHTINIANVFDDPDDDAFTVSATNSTNTVITVALSGSTLTITEKGLGSSNVTLTADDDHGDVITDQFKVTVNNGVGFYSPTMPISFTVFPNPSKGLVNLTLSGDYLGEVILTLSDASGRVVYLQNYSSATQLGELDLSKLDCGIYILRVRTTDTEFVEKIVLE